MASGNVTVNTNQAQQALKNLERTFERLGRTSSKNLRPLGEGLSAATANASEFEKSLTAANARVIAFGASAGLIVKMQQAFGELVKSTIEVEKSLKDINVILGATDKGLRQFSAGMFKIAKDTGQAFETVAAAATELSRQGLSAEKTLQRTKDAMILARLAGMDAVGAVEALTATLNTFNQSGLDSTKVVNKLAKVDAAFAVSSQDLAQALQRVGASAKGANVSFDELLAIVTAAQQKTARGGAVIGNSFKTIFTRIQRPEVLNQLEALGVAVRDVQGNTLPAIKVLSGLAKTYDSLSSAQKSVVSEQVAGVFQINILKAALGDLNSEYGIYQGALRAASSATNEAIQRNAELNTTTAALLNQTKNSFKEFASSVGEVALAPTMKKLLGQLNSVLEAGTIDKDAEGMGAKVGRGFVEGLGKFIGGPGLVLAGVVTAKLFASFAKFAKEAYVAFTGQNTAAQQRASIQQNILNLLQQEPSILQQVKSGQMTVNQVAQAYLNTLRQQNQLQAQNVALARQAAAVTYGAGARVRGGRTRTPSFALATTPVRAGGDGMIPNFAKTSKEIFGAAVQAERTTSLTNIAAGKQIGAVTFSPAQQRAAASVLARRKAGQEQGTKKSAARIHQSDSTLLAYSGAVPANGMSSYTFKKTKSGVPYTVNFPVASFKKDIEPSPNLQQSIEKFADKQILDFASKFKPTVNPSGLSAAKAKSEGYQGALASTVGAMFESGMRLAFGNSVRGTTGGTFDVAQMPRELAQYFKGKIIGPKADFKNSISDGNRKSFANKIIRDENLPVFAKNLMPNFSALGAAIAREKAAGIPSSAIRVGRSSQLVSSSNPNGLAVYNTIDEPRGLSQGINRYKSAGLNPKMAGTPNFATMTQLGFSSGKIGKAGGGTLSNADKKRFLDAQRNLMRQYVKSNMTQAQLEKEARNLAQKRKLSSGAESKYVSAMNTLAKKTKERYTRMNSASGRAGRMAGRMGGMGSLGATMGLSMLAGSAEQFIPGQTGRAISGAAGGAATGASLGMMFGPIGAAIGGVAGGLFGLVKAMDPVKNAMADLAEASSKAAKELELQQNASNRVIGLVEEITSGKLSQGQLEAKRKDLGFAINQLTPDQRALFQNNGNIIEATQKLQENQAQKNIEAQQREGLRKAGSIDQLKGLFGADAANKMKAFEEIALRNIETKTTTRALQGTGGYGVGPTLVTETKDVYKSKGIKDSIRNRFAKELEEAFGLKENEGKDVFDRLKLGEPASLKNFFKSLEATDKIPDSIQELGKSAQETENFTLKFAKALKTVNSELAKSTISSARMANASAVSNAGFANNISLARARGASEFDLLDLSARQSRTNLFYQQEAQRRANKDRGLQLRAKILGDTGLTEIAPGSLKDVIEKGEDFGSTKVQKALAGITDTKKREEYAKAIQDYINSQTILNEKIKTDSDILEGKIKTDRDVLSITQQRIEDERQYNDTIRKLGLTQQEAISALEARIAADREIADFTRNLAIQRASIGKGPAEIARMEAAGKLSNIQSEISGAGRSYNLKKRQIGDSFAEINTQSIFGEDVGSTLEARDKLAVIDRNKINLDQNKKRELEKLDQLLAKEEELDSQYKQQKVSLEERRRVIEETSALEIKNIERQISLRGTLQDIMSEYAMSNEAIQKELSDNMKEVARGMKSDFKGAFKSFIDGSKSAKEAFRNFALSVMDRLMDMAASYSTNLLFSNIGKGVGLMGFSGGGKVPTKRARGGMISGGSGVRDDVPAMLMGGEYVVKKSAVDALGVGFMNRINSYAEGGVVAENKFIMGTEGDPTNYGKRGKFSVGSRLSAMAITSEDNPQNARRDAMAAEDEQRVQRFRDYEERNRQAMAEFKRANRQKLIGAVINAGFMIGMDAFGKFLDQQALNKQVMSDMDKNVLPAAGGPFAPLHLQPHGASMIASAQGGSAISSLISPIKPINRAYGGGTGTSMSPSMPMANTSTGVGGGSGAFAMLASSIQQLSASIQSNGGSTGGGGETTVNLTFNIDKSGKAEAKDGENKQGMDSKKKSTEDEKQERQLGDMMKTVVLQTINEQKRPGGILYQS